MDTLQSKPTEWFTSRHVVVMFEPFSGIKVYENALTGTKW